MMNKKEGIKWRQKLCIQLQMCVAINERNESRKSRGIWLARSAFCDRFFVGTFLMNGSETAENKSSSDGS